MYQFTCPHGHMSRSAARIGSDARCPVCREATYRVASAEDLVQEGINAHDCVREVLADNGVTYNLHLRTGLAYTNAELRRSAGVSA
jgi:hypothetical protein